MTFDIFISHRHRDAPYAQQFKKRIQEDFSELDVFVSSDDDGVRPGILLTKTFDALRITETFNALREAKIVIVLYTSDSPVTPWITFELGFAHALDKTIFSFCYSHDDIYSIPSPSNYFSVWPTSSNNLRNLYDEISTEFDRPHVSDDDVECSYDKLRAVKEELVRTKTQNQLLETCDSVGAFVYRFNSENNLEVLLIRTKSTDRYIFPKGVLEQGRSKMEILEEELLEEAGVRGRIESTPIVLDYRKGNNAKQTIAMYPVLHEITQEPEQIGREPKWFLFNDAIAALSQGRPHTVCIKIVAAFRKMKKYVDDK